MRLSTTPDSVALLYPSSTHGAANLTGTPSHTTMNHFKRAVTSIISKLPQQSQATKKYRKVSPVIKNNNSTYIKIVSKKQHRAPVASPPSSPPSSPPQPSNATSSSAISREHKIYRDLRNYYTNNNNSAANQRQSAEVDHQQHRVEHHQTVQQYQDQQQTRKTNQSSSVIKKAAVLNRWKEGSSSLSCIAPPQFITHTYIRDIRSNPNHLRLLAMTNNYCSQNNTTLNPGKMHVIQRRQDQFVWGNGSSLRNGLTIAA
ncbi:hypothetical protein BDF20DRAFT_893323 [Mycotypha africana]|uniref:uncharacterized protein n=1 Tax=Mycotypha africana TaxID=64632 RepID=UPI0023003DC3|nr:uncharacterized protein BDF20DRAFT_893323 [Mycotypha africana]KAI8969115.1 hypothetical protein BDF20DRAFT_893323 [Mycotypha africana]